MPRLTDLTGLAGAAVVIVAVVVTAGRAAGLRRSRLAVLAGVSGIVALVPLGALLPAAALLRGVVGDLSLTTLVLLLRGLRRDIRRTDPVGARTTFTLRSIVVVTGLVLYPLALGLGAWEPYRLGYGKPWFLASLLAVSLGALLAELPLVTFCIALGVLAWSVGAYESRNLWDYLIDPLVFVWASGTLLLDGARALVRRYRQPLGRALDTRAGSGG